MLRRSYDRRSIAARGVPRKSNQAKGKSGFTFTTGTPSFGVSVQTTGSPNAPPAGFTRSVARPFAFGSEVAPRRASRATTNQKLNIGFCEMLRLVFAKNAP